MANRSVISVHAKPATTKRLEALASATRRSKSFLANEAIERYLDEEEAFIESIKRGQADVAAGRVHTTDEVRDRLKAAIKPESA
ncbi:MAG: ribbon-helix-helix protein, CopG family [Gammaproteobacteria bacterium]|nr:ribbon-helix-helix protein, CopG family [Gammaproteobacteria bacterium]